MFAGRPPFAFLRWFQLFCLFHLVSAVCLPDLAAIFRLPSTFVVWSFFLCHRHLWSVLSFLLSSCFVFVCFCFCLFLFLFVCVWVQFLSYTAFSAVGIRARLTVFAFFLS